MANIDALAAALDDDYNLIDHDDFWQIVRDNGEHVGLVTPQLLVQIDLSVIVFPRDEAHLYALAEAADALLRAKWTAPFAEVGFGIAEEGSIQAAEAVDGTDPIHSYELPCVTQAEDVEMVALVVGWVEEQTREFMLFDVDGPLVITEPVAEEATDGDDG